MRAIVKMNRNHFNPFMFLNGIENELWNNSLEKAWTPISEWSEKDAHYLLSVDLPGVSKENMELNIDKGMLELRAERGNQDGPYYRSYYRSYTLPEGIDEDKIEAVFENGVLMLAIPKSEQAKPKTIQISERKKTRLWDRLLGNDEGKTKTIDVGSKEEVTV